MPNDLRLVPSGLWTAPAAVTAPPGALQDAEECVIRRVGVVEPRPGFSVDTTTLPSASITPERLLEREAQDGTADLLAVGQHSAAYLLYLGGTGEIKERTRNTSTGTYSSASLTRWKKDRIWGSNVRGNLYMTAADGVRALASRSGGAITNGQPFKAGLRTPHLVTTATTSGQALLLNQCVTYRACLRFTDENGVIRRSGVSGRASPTAGATGAANAVTVYVVGSLLLSAGQAGYPETTAIEIYRTENSTVFPPPDEHFYVGEVLLSDAEDAAAGYTTYTDNVADADLGVALYVNTLEEGAEANHVQIPTAGCSSVFNGSLFLGNLSYAPSQLLYIPHTSGINNSDTTSVGSRTRTVTFTNGSNQMTAISTMTGLKVGMIILASTNFSGATTFTRITALNVGASSATLSDTYTGSTATGATIIYDSLVVDGAYFPVLPTAAFGLSITAAFIRGGRVTPTIFALFADPALFPHNIGSSTVQCDQIGLDGASAGYLHLYKTVADQITPTSFTLAATHGAAYQPALPEPTATPLTVSQEDQPNGIAWSNNLEPEHFQGGNEDRIAPNGRIMAMHALGNALLVFLDKGLWRVAGSGAESGFRFDQMDQDMRLIFPYAASRLRDLVYAHGDKGICACDENSAQPLTAVNLRDRLQPVQDLTGAGSATASGFFAFTNRKADEVLFSVPATTGLTIGERLYVYNAVTQAWTNWFMASTDMVAGLGRAAGGLVVMSVNLGLRTERAITNDPLYAVDAGALAFTVTGTSGATITFTTSAWAPAVGDLVKDGAGPAYYLVTAVISSTQVTLDRAWLGTSNSFAYSAYTSKITPVAFLAQATGYLKNWGEARVHWGSTQGMVSYTVSCTSALSSSAVSQTRVIASSRQASDQPETFRFVVPKDHARTTRVFPSLIMTQGGSDWRYEGMDVSYTINSDRVLRRR